MRERERVKFSRFLKSLRSQSCLRSLRYLNPPCVDRDERTLGFWQDV